MGVHDSVEIAIAIAMEGRGDGVDELVLSDFG